MRHASSVIIPAGEPPEWIEVVPAGKFSTRDGRGPFVNDDSEAVLRRTDALRMDAGYPIDYDHATDFAAPEGQPAPAAGWMTAFKIENGVILAKVEWTPQGAHAVTNRNWRHVSPVFDGDKQGHVMRLVRAALTNNRICKRARSRRAAAMETTRWSTMSSARRWRRCAASRKTPRMMISKAPGTM